MRGDWLDRADLLIVGGDTEEISIWNLQQQQCVASNAIYQLPVTALSFLPDRRLVSCGIDATIRRWELVAVGSIDFPRPYQGMNINDVKGLNQCQLSTLYQLGAQL